MKKPSTRNATPRKPARVPPATATPSPNDLGGGDEYLVSVRYRVGSDIHEFNFRLRDRQFYPVVQEWRYVVANRRRITDESRNTLSQDIFERLLELHDPAGKQRADSAWKQSYRQDMLARVKDLAKSGLVEVVIPYVSEAQGWAARLFPWEQTIGLLTRPYRGVNEQLTVLRFLQKPDAAPTAKLPRSPLLAVRSGPGELGKMFDLDGECQLVAKAMCPDQDPRELILIDPDEDSLRARLLAGQPAVVHLAGVDSSSLRSYGLAPDAADDGDGFVLRDVKKLYRGIRPGELAELLTVNQQRPTLVAVSSCFSAGRMAPLAVAAGVHHAIGFQDTITDADVLLFFTAFYQAWARGLDLVEAFSHARTQLSLQISVQASSGVVLWSDRSLLPTGPVPREATAKAAGKATVKGLSKTLELDIKPRNRLNYSLLHNNRSPFEKFLVVKGSQDDPPPLEVEIALSVGPETCHCRFTKKLPVNLNPVTLADDVHLPLIAGVLRQCTESLRSNLYTRVKCGDDVLCERSDLITVLPADEWRDDGKDHCWLPSFVLPRDPAVLRLTVAAHRYLRTLLDDCAAGFDGYQGLSDDDSNAADLIDPQVQAFWAAIQHEVPLAYINPPPAYTSESQRLRTPTQIFEGRAATCIDLALLFASCLEYVGIYPVLFLIEGHAFPGYWRSDKAWWRMRQMQMDGRAAVTTTPAGDEALRNAPSGVDNLGNEKWMFVGADNLRELLSYIESGELVPFESTYVTLQRGFQAALDDAPANLQSETFDSMVDVQIAREADVTPLPLLEPRR